eukprot:TRINITY_DN13199_c0_g1_i5.p1 TRINITY_DN13199_c0_g1~~TRINITY_DN13199_c0_g1_i5.p1  ORF type:complete len:358 (+),score=15.93 TRINITY_DN13199_c0_g1_i5:170-1243(+)
MCIRDRLYIVYNEGIKRFTTKRLSEVIGLSEAAIFRHYASKKDIFLDILNDLETFLIGDLLEITKQNFDTREKIKRVVCKTISYMIQNKGVNVLMLSEVSINNDSDLKVKLANIFSSLRNVIEEIVTEGIRLGEYDSRVDVKTFSLLFMGIPVAINVELLLNPTNFDTGHFCMNMQQIFLQKCIQNIKQYKMEKFKSKLTSFLILEFFWIIWNNTLDFKVWIYGIIPSMLIVLMFSPSVDIFKGIKFTPKGVFYSFVYIFVFIWALIKSNIDVMLRVISPKLNIKPGIVRIETKLKSPMARLILANSITLTPGTFVVDIKDNYFYIHWIEVCCDGDIETYTNEISGQFEKLLLKIYE